MLEGPYKTRLVRRIERDLPGSFVLKNDANYLQGIPDLTVLFRTRWGMLEVKTSEDAPFQPNQEFYLEHLGDMSFARCIYPENEEEVLHELYRSLTLRRTSRIPQRK